MKSLFRCFFTALLFLLAGCQSSSETNKGELRIGVNTPFVPFAFIDEKGEYRGFDIDMAKEMAKRLNKQLVIVEMGFDALILALQQGQIDLIIAGMTINEERLKKVDMLPYRSMEEKRFSLLFWESIPPSISSLEDFQTLSAPAIAAQIGTVQVDYLAQFPSIHTVVLDHLDDVIFHIKYGKTTAALVDDLVGEKIVQKQPNIARLSVIATTDQAGPEGVGIKKGNTDLKQDVERLLNDFRQEGLLQQWEAKWCESAL